MLIGTGRVEEELLFRKIMIGGVTAAVIVGAGGTALAVSGSDTGSGTPSGSGTSGTHDTNHSGKNGHGKKAHRALRRVDHAQIVLHTKKGFVTRQLIKGTVTAVSASSITVQSQDKTTETFQVTKNTKVHTRSDGKRTESSIAKVSKGDRVFVGGLGSGKPVAMHIADRGTK